MSNLENYKSMDFSPKNCPYHIKIFTSIMNTDDDPFIQISNAIQSNDMLTLNLCNDKKDKKILIDKADWKKFKKYILIYKPYIFSFWYHHSSEKDMENLKGFIDWIDILDKEYFTSKLSYETTCISPNKCPYFIWAYSPIHTKKGNPFIYVSNGKSNIQFTEIIKIDIINPIYKSEYNIDESDFKKIEKIINIYKESLIDCWYRKRTLGSIIDLYDIEWDLI